MLGLPTVVNCTKNKWTPRTAPADDIHPGRVELLRITRQRDRVKRSITAAQAFFRKALATHSGHGPLKVTLDGHQPSHRALRLLRREHATWRRVKVRSCKYLNNIIEQDHRAIKVKCRAMKSFQSFQTAKTTIAGIELAHRIRKRQFVGLDRNRSRPIDHARAWFAAVMV